MPNILREITPERVGDYPWGHPEHDPDLHCTKFLVVTEDMQEEEKIAEKKLYKQFVDEPIHGPDWRTMFLIPKTNLRIPHKWFDYDSDAAAFIRAVARANNVGVHTLGKSTTGNSLCMFIDVVWKYRHLRMKKEEDPPRMSLQERRIRHWKAVMDESSIATLFTLRLVRHVTFMLVGASLDFAKSNAKRGKSNDLSGKIEKMCDWFQENDADDLNSFEFLQPQRQKLHHPDANAGSQPRRRGWAPGKEKSKYIPNHRKRKAETYDPPDFQSKRQRQTLPPLAIPVPGEEIELPERIAD